MSEQEKWAKRFVDELYAEMLRRSDGTSTSVWIARGAANANVPEVPAHPKSVIGIRDILGVPEGYSTLDVCRELMTRLETQEQTIGKYQAEVKDLVTQIQVLEGDIDQKNAERDEILRAVCPDTDDKHLDQMDQDDLLDAIKSLHGRLNASRVGREGFFLPFQLKLAGVLGLNTSSEPELLEAVTQATDRAKQVDNLASELRLRDATIKRYEASLDAANGKLNEAGRVGREGFFLPLVKLLGLSSTASYGKILEVVAKATDRAEQVDQANERLTNMHTSRSSFLFKLAGILGLETSCETELLHAVTQATMNRAVKLDPITQSRPLQLDDVVQLRQATVRDHGSGWVVLCIDGGSSHLTVMPRDIAGRLLPGGK